MGTSNKAVKLLSKMAELEETALMDLTSVKRSVLPGLQIAKNDAQQQVAKVYDEYKQFIHDNVFVIVTQGSDEAQLKFAALLKDKAGALLLNGSQLYKRFAETVEPSMHPTVRQFSVTQQSLLMAEMNAVMAELNIRSLPMPKFTEVKLCKTFDDVVAACREMVRGSMEDDFSRLFIEAQLYKLAKDVGYDQTAIPLVLTTLTSDEAKSLPLKLFSGNHMILSLPEAAKIDETFLADSASQIRDAITAARRRK